MSEFTGCILDVKANRNTISIVAKFNTEDDVRLLADDVEVHPLVFNPINGLHYSMLWFPEGTIVNRLEAVEPNVIEDGPWTTLTTPVARPVRERQLVVSPIGNGTEFSHQNPGKFEDAVALATRLGDTEILMKDGVYRPTSVGSDYMVEFENANLAFEKVNVVAQYPRRTIVSNLLDDSDFTYSLVPETDGVFVVDGAPDRIHQLHGLVDGKVERLQEGADPLTPWTKNTLNSSPLGGWFRDAANNQLVVKLPDKSNPRHKLRISNTDYVKAWLWRKGQDVWIEGVVFEYWLELPPISTNARRNGSSIVLENCEQIVVRDCESRYTMNYACSFIGCHNYLVENCDFIDGQKYTSYRHVRVSPEFNKPNEPRFSGCVRNYDSSLGTIRNNRWRECFVVNQFISDAAFKTECIEFHRNHVFQARNHPILVNFNGGRHAIWANCFDTCGQVMPNNESSSPISPVYWVNNLAVEAGYFGTTYLPDGVSETQTAGAIKGNRFGGGEFGSVGQYYFYYNTLRVEWYPEEEDASDQIQLINAWAAQRKDHSSSRYYNNIFTSVFRDVIHVGPTGNHIWHFSGELEIIKENLSNMHWDHNQYYWDKGDQEGAFNVGSSSVTDFTFQEMRDWVADPDSGIRRKFEPAGAFLDPEFDVNSHPTQTINAMRIPGITGNPVLRNPNDVSGSNL